MPRSLKGSLQTIGTNVGGTLNVLVAARDTKVKHVVFAASCSDYVETPMLPKREHITPA